MRAIRVAVLLLAVVTTVPVFAFCWDCNWAYGCYQCETTYYNAHSSCTVTNNGYECVLYDSCEGELGDQCTGPSSDCVVQRAELRDDRHRNTEWQLVSVKIERPKRTPQS